MDAKMKKESSHKYGSGSKERSQNKGSSYSKYSPPVNFVLFSAGDT